MKRTFDLIDLAKLIGSILILTMHLNAFADYGRARLIIELLARWGVPFFFVASAYFLFSKSQRSGAPREAIVGYTKRIAILYLVWMIFNIPSILYIRLWNKNLSSPEVWFVFFKNSILSSTFTGSWYLISCVFSAWFVSALCRRCSTKKAVLVSALLYLLCIMSSAYCGILPDTIASILTFLCFPLNLFNGCVFFALGKYISENEKALTERFGALKCALGAVFFYSLYLCEIYITKSNALLSSTDAAFSLVPLSFFMLLFCLQQKAKIRGNLVMRKLSAVIYCCQGNVLVIKNHLEQLFGIRSSIQQYLVSVLLVSLICAGVLLLQSNKTHHWTEYLT